MLKTVTSTVGGPVVDHDGFWMGDYGPGGGPGRPPCWRTLKESCKGLGSVSLKINHQPTNNFLNGETNRGRRDGSVARANVTQ
jgi:hypothetical protein